MTDEQRRSAARESAREPKRQGGSLRAAGRLVAETATTGASDVAGTLADAGEAIAGAGEAIASAGAPIVARVAPLVTKVEPIVKKGQPLRAAARRWRTRRRLRRHHLLVPPAQPLPNLFELHPDARRAPMRELGLREIPVAEIVGTAVEGPAQRGSDFLPLPRLRTRNWQARWQRILAASREMRTLPPIDVLRAAGAYWVMDGHNRVAAARALGQIAIDAAVTALRLPGDGSGQPEQDGLAAMLVDGASLRAAGAGRLTAGATLPESVPSTPMGGAPRSATAGPSEPAPRRSSSPAPPGETRIRSSDVPAPPAGAPGPPPDAPDRAGPR